MFVHSARVALFTRAKQPTCPSEDERVGTGFIHTVQRHPATQRREMRTQKNLRDTVKK